MRGGILGVEEEAYYCSYLDSPGHGRIVYYDASRAGLGCVFMQCIVMVPVS